MVDELKSRACPFCGSADVSEGEVLTERPSGATVTQSMCRKCGALGPEAILPAGEADYGDVRATAEWNRRAAPIAAQLDAEGLPPLPAPIMGLWSEGIRKAWADQLRAYGQECAASAIAPYAERIRLLERELATVKESSTVRAPSIDTPEFRERFKYMLRSEYADLIAHIDGRTAGTAEGEVEYELFEVQGDDTLMVAGTSGKRAYEEILHYAAQYAQDGPVEICRVVRTKLSIPVAAPSPQSPAGGEGQA